jgi:hypothetical protein
MSAIRDEDNLPPWNRPITDADRRAARAAIEAERAGDDGAIFRFIDTPMAVPGITTTRKEPHR